MRIAVYTLTRERFPYTRTAFESLKARAGCDYDHYVFDNGSADETVDWLMQNSTEFKWTQFSPTNVGISQGSNTCLAAIEARGPYDLIVKFDNDCCVLSDDILYHFSRVFGDRDIFDSHVLAPDVVGLMRPPRRSRYRTVGSFALGYPPIVGGIFHVVPAPIYKQYGKYPTNLPFAKGQDDDFCFWLRRNGKVCAYVENLKVEHIDTTDGQAQKFPEYFKRKFVEEVTVPQQ